MNRFPKSKKKTGGKNGSCKQKREVLVLDDLQTKNILLLGLGREGMNTYSFLRCRFPDKPLGLADQLTLAQLPLKTQEIIKSDGQVSLFLGEDYLKSVKNYDLIFKSPGIPPHLPEVKEAEKAGRVTSNTELFFQLCPGVIVGVTGTKGKSTTTSLIFQVLKEGGIDACLAGNIGVPPLSSLDCDILPEVFVLELSSHQLRTLKQSPQVAVLLNIFREHLDYYPNFKAYLRAKKTITARQSKEDYLIFNLENPWVRKIADQSKAKKIPFGLSSSKKSGCFLEGDFIVFNGEGKREKVIKQEEVPLKGRFNLQNVMPAVIVGYLFGLPRQKITKGIRSFIPLKHRLEYLGSHEGVDFYNDSLATIPEATINAIQAFVGRRLILILGGFDRGQNFAKLAETILASKVRKLVFLPTTGQRIWEEISKGVKTPAELPAHVLTVKMAKAVQEAYQSAEPGDVILLSPASASFGGFKNYEDRGEQFKRAFQKLKGST